MASLRGRSSTATAVQSPLLTPSSRAYLDDAMLNGLRASSSNSSVSRLYAAGSKKLPDDHSTVLDQLHAEQKSTIEALTYQIEFYRQREERSKKEVETLRKYVNEAGETCGGASSDEAVSVARLARENRALGDEVDALRSKQNAWSVEKRRLQRQQHELEQQLQDARQSLTTFTQAIEQLELKMQRQEAEEQTRALEADQELRQKVQENEQLRRECAALRHQIDNMQSASSENERLRREVQALSHETATQKTEVETATQQMKTELRDLQRRLSDAEAVNRQRESTLLDLQAKLVHATSETSSLRVDIEKKVADIRELDQKLQRSTELLELREKLLTSDAATRQECETLQFDLRSQVNALERERSELRNELAACERTLQGARKDLEAAKVRLMNKDHGVMVATLRSEIAGVKERLRAEFKHEKDALLTEKASLSKEITLLNSRLSEKERFIHRLQDEMLVRESSEQHTARETSSLRSTIRQLEAEVANAQNKYQQLVDARSSLAEQLDHGFKELLEDENTATALLRQVEQMQRELNEAKQALATSEARRNAAFEELQAVQQQHKVVTSTLRKKIDELYDDLRRTEEGVYVAKQLETKVYLLEQEKSNHDSETTSLRAQFEARIVAEQQTAQNLRDAIAALKAEKAQQHAKIIAMQDEITAREGKIDELKTVVSDKEANAEAVTLEAHKLLDRVQHLQKELDDVRATITSSQEEKGKRERKLLRERRVLEEQVAKLVSRIEGASTRNSELGDKAVALMKQLKSYEAEIIALETQLKAEKQKRRELDRAMASVQRTAGQDAESSEDLKRRLHEVTSLKESYQAEMHQLKRSLERAQSEKDVVHRQRDEAIKRVSMLMKCQEQMKSTVESHTAELVEEIEAVQGQLDDERKRTTVLLANEKTLLRDINEKNTSINRLQQGIASLQQQQREATMMFRPDVRKASPREGSSASFPTLSTSPTAGGPTTPKTSNSSAVSSSAQELDRLLGNLERISEFSSARSPSASFCR